MGVVARPLPRALVVLPVLFGLQVALAAEIRLWAVSGDVLLLAAITAGLVGGPERGARYGFALGILSDLVTRLPLGIAGLTFAAVAYAVGFVPEPVLDRRRAYVGVVAGATAVAAVFQAVVAVLFGRDDLVGVGIPKIAVIMAVLHAVAALPMRAVGRFVLLTGEFGRR
jgi:cell shape-determining protein MreD